MTQLELYIVPAFLILIVAALLAHKADSPPKTYPHQDDLQSQWDGPCLSLGERIFDPADYLWLRHELGFPELAGTLARARREMALRWLRAIRNSFEGLVRVPQSAGASRARGSWKLLRLALRFHILLGYATLVVRLFGPYHRLVPSLHWVPPLLRSRSTGQKAGYGTAGIGPMF